MLTRQPPDRARDSRTMRSGQPAHDGQPTRDSLPTRDARPARPGPRCSGQSLVEFSLVLGPLLLVLLGIIQFGFIFNSYVTMTNSAREGAREGTIYVYDRTLTKDQNDLARNNLVKTSVLGSMNLLGKTATWLLYAGIGFRIVTHDRTAWPLWIFWIGLGGAVVAAMFYVRDAWKELHR